MVRAGARRNVLVPAIVGLAWVSTMATSHILVNPGEHLSTGHIRVVLSSITGHRTNAVSQSFAAQSHVQYAAPPDRAEPALASVPDGPPAAPPRPTEKVIGDVPLIWQIYSLSCEAAALQMALSHQGIATDQDAILKEIGIDGRRARWDSQGLRWGDPYSAFVGAVTGTEDSYTGYGTYYPTIKRAATALGGRVLSAGEGIDPQALYDSVLDGHPAVVWIPYDYEFHPRRDYVTFEGRRVLYAGPIEHAAVLVGVDAASVLIRDPLFGEFRLDKSQFENGYRTYNQMAVVLA
jgi:uncharacterized protein YvpB